MQRVTRRIVRWTLEHRLVVGVLFLAWAALATWGAAQVRLDFSSAAFYGDESPKLERWRQFQARFGADDRALAVIVERPSGEPLLDAVGFAEMERLAAAFERDPEVERVLTLGRLRPTPTSPPLAETLARLDPSLTDAAIRTLLRDERVVPLWVSADGRTTVLVVELRTTSDDLFVTTGTIERLRTILDEVAEASDLTFEMAGIPAIRGAFFHLTRRDQMLLVPISMVLIGAGLWLALGHLGLVVVIALGVSVPMLGLVGLMGWSGEPIGLLNQTYFTVLPAIFVADLLHLVVAVRRHARAGTPWHDAIVSGTASVSWACSLTSLTTAVGFASLALTSMPILRHFGLYAAAGMLLAYATVIVGTPWMMATLPAPPRFLREEDDGGGFAARLGAFAVRRPKSVLLVTLAVTAASFAFVPRVAVDSRLSDLLLPTHPVARASATLDRDLGGSLALELELHAPAAAWEDGEARRVLEALEAWGGTQPEVRAMLSPRLDPAWLHPEGFARISLRVADLGAEAFGAFAARARSEIERATAGTAVRGDVTGTVDLAYHGLRRINDELRGSLLSAFLVVTVLIGGLFGSVLWGLLSVPPNMLPVLAGYAVLAPLGVTLDPLAAVILAVILGLAVDDTIHLFAAVRHAREEGLHDEDALHHALRESGRALTITSIVLAVGLSINLFSSFPPLRLLGGWGGSLILLAWLGDVLVLPALLRLVGEAHGPTVALPPRAESGSPAATRH